MANELGALRRSQVISVYGPGAIIDFRVGGYSGAPVSVVSAGLDEWDSSTQSPGNAHPQTTHEPRLQRKLGVSGFRLPPVFPEEDKNAERLLGVRFPRWLQCPRCNRIGRSGSGSIWASEPGSPLEWCPFCTTGTTRRARRHVVPVRLVSACTRGHLDEFPWESWAHRGAPPADHANSLFIERRAGSSLSSLWVRCAKCNDAGRSLGECFGVGALRLQCRGHRPWLGVDEQCGEQLRAVQRGASNLYFPIVESALDIPPWSDTLQKRLGIYWEKIRQRETPAQRRMYIEGMDLHAELKMPLDILVEQIEERLRRLEEDDDILAAEYRQFLNPQTSRIDSPTEFEAIPLVVPPEFDRHVGSLIQARRLREVRVLRAFNRLVETGDPQPLSSHPLDWLPAVELRGEGVFATLSEERLAAWESQPAVQTRFHQLVARAGNRVHGGLTARSVLLHSLAHLLITELGIECGYSEASLRERVYVGPEMAGVLVFTGTPDSEGTLGGLMRQAEPNRFASTLRAALTRASWCANDPLCIHGTSALADEGNLAACHACLLLPETSCTGFNRELDRGLVVGVPGQSGVGFFEGCF